MLAHKVKTFQQIRDLQMSSNFPNFQSHWCKSKINKIKDKFKSCENEKFTRTLIKVELRTLSSNFLEIISWNSVSFNNLAVSFHNEKANFFDLKNYQT